MLQPKQACNAEPLGKKEEQRKPVSLGPLYPEAKVWRLHILATDLSQACMLLLLQDLVFHSICRAYQVKSSHEHQPNL